MTEVETKKARLMAALTEFDAAYADLFGFKPKELDPEAPKVTPEPWAMHAAFHMELMHATGPYMTIAYARMIQRAFNDAAHPAAA